MAIEAIVGDIGGAVLEPFDRDVVRIERRVLDLGVGSEPVNALALLAPEAVWVLDRLRVHCLIFGVVDERSLLPVRRNLIDLISHRFLRTAVAQGRFSQGHFASLHYATACR